MKDVPTELFLIVEEKKPSNNNFSNAQENGKSCLDCSKGQYSSGEQADFQGKFHVKGGSFPELFIFDI